MKKKIENLVQEVLGERGVERPPVPVEDIARSVGALIRYVPFEGEGEVSGMLFRNAEQTIIGVNSLHHPNRQRFTIAHELGHLLLHKEQEELHVDTGVYSVQLRDNVSSQAVSRAEMEANRFAAELLMPKSMLLAELRAGEVDFESEDGLLNLARRYRVSAQAMSLRLNNLGVISA